jgi:hypothetical protein
MLADTTATNMLANDPGGSLAALPDPGRLRRLLRVKTIALALAVGPVCAAVCLAVAIAVGRLAAGLALAATLLALPFGTVAVAAWLGVLLPYHRHRLAWRWLHRRPWRRALRWGVLVVAPYTVVPALTATLLAPGLLVGVDLRHRDGHAHLAGRSVVAAAGLGCLAAAIAFWLGPYVTARLAARRGAALAAYLRDPERG